MVLHTRTHTAPKAGLRLRVNPVMPRTHGCEIDKSTFIGMLSRKNMVVQSTLVVLDIFFIAIKLKKHFRQFQHVIRVAGFRTLFASYHRREVIDGVKMFTNTVSTYG